MYDTYAVFLTPTEREDMDDSILNVSTSISTLHHLKSEICSICREWDATFGVVLPEVPPTISLVCMWAVSDTSVDGVSRMYRAYITT